jgi:uncharacterized protein YfaQ (DUF2300 family)
MLMFLVVQRVLGMEALKTPRPSLVSATTIRVVLLLSSSCEFRAACRSINSSPTGDRIRNQRITSAAAKREIRMQSRWN